MMLGMAKVVSSISAGGMTAIGRATGIREAWLRSFIIWAGRIFGVFESFGWRAKRFALLIARWSVKNNEIRSWFTDSGSERYWSVTGCEMRGRAKFEYILREEIFQMAFFGKAKKQDLVLLAEELGQKVSDKMTNIELRNIIIGSKDYEEEFVRDQLSVILEERFESGK
ncbi:hypothetical protein TNCV_1799391 [Trichonephila clavipes]|uniref:Uncharacterized protein n=1 Tax=Trichonephila clavipes TaxID=2585209 RepID=A0A8X6VBT2_TRICX|nr:hypothetical protein TNCV_1799391 [Trichonephila clavipes]